MRVGRLLAAGMAVAFITAGTGAHAAGAGAHAAGLGGQRRRLDQSVHVGPGQNGGLFF